MASVPETPSPGPLEAVPATKLVPPRAARRLIARDALMARLADARRLRCVILRSPAGSGKTSTLVAWRQALLTLDTDVAWLSAAAEDNDVSRFLDCLTASLAEVDPAIVREAMLLTGHDPDEAAIEHRVIALVQGVASLPRRLALMIDDLHHLDDPAIGRALQWLLDYAPPNLLLVAASRQAPPFSLGRLRAQGDAAEFELRDLLFSTEESEAFLRERLGDIGGDDAQALHRLTGGWVAGLQLLAVDLNARRRTRVPRAPVRDAGAFARYVEREVLVRLSPDDLELLTRLAVCNRFCAQLCATLAGLPHAVAHMMVRLTQLDRDELFISQISTRDRETWYRLHPLLREVLRLRLDERPPPERQALHALAWRWFRQHGHVDEAVRHAVLAGESDAAADLVEACADELLARGDYGQFASLVRRLPREALEGPRSGLRIALARLQLYAGQVDALDESVRRLRAESESGTLVLNRRERFDLAYLRGGLALQRDDADEIAISLPDLRDLPPDAGDFRTAGRSNVLAWAYLFQGQWDRARAVLHDVSENEASPQTRLTGRCLLGLSYSLQGRIAEAEPVLHDVLTRAEREGNAFAVTGQLAACLLADVFYERNDPEAACGLLERRIDLMERISIPDAVMRAMRSLALAHRLAGRDLEAWGCLERMHEYAARRGLDRLLGHALNIEVHWHLRDGARERAARALDRLLAIEARRRPPANSADHEIGLLASRARVAMFVGDRAFDRAVGELRGLLDASRASGRARHAAGVHAQLSLSLARCGQREEAHSHLLEAVRLGHRLGLVRTLLDTWLRFPTALQSLRDDPAVDPVLGFYVNRLLAAAAQAGAGRPSAEPGGDAGALARLSEREVQVLGLLAQTMANKRIARVLNVSPDTVKWHLKNIYAKLGVTSRDAAVARLRDGPRR